MCLILSGSCPITVTVALGDSLSLNKDGSVCRCIWKGDVRPINGLPHEWVLSVSMMESEKPCVGRERRMAAINRTGQVKPPLIPRWKHLSHHHSCVCRLPIVLQQFAWLLFSTNADTALCSLESCCFYEELC